MNFSDLYWKWKRFFRKRKELIGRIISITLSVVLAVVVAYAAYNIYQADLERKAAADVPKDESQILAIKKPDYDRTKIGDEYFVEIASNDKIVLSANTNTGEIRLEDEFGKKWYSNPQDRESVPKRGAENKGREELGSQLLAHFVTVGAKEVTDDAIYGNFEYSVKEGTMTHVLVKDGDKTIGIKFTFGFTKANVYIPVQYILTEDGFQAEIVVDEIKSVGSSAFLLTKVSLLPFFGAGNRNEDGYLFVPDGSGALVEFNNNKNQMQSYVDQVYGNNLTTYKKQDYVKQTIRLPIFGAKVENNAFLGVITTGDANSSISAASYGQMNVYNVVYATAVLNDYSLTRTTDGGGNGKNTDSISVAPNQTENKNYCVRYFFMEGEEANYVGMSERYRDYLEENDLLYESPLADKKYMVLDLVGAVSIQKYVMGVKRPVVTALTTYNDVVEIVKELKSKGVDNLIINYIGAMDSGLNNEIYDQVKVESALGSKKEFRNMVSYLKDQGVILFLESNPVDLYENGNGYKENRDSVKTWYDAYAFQYKYFLDTKTSDSASRWHLLRPALVSEAVADFTSSLNKWNLSNLSLDRIGGFLYSDYNEDPELYISRESARNAWCQMLQKAAESTDYLMIHGGNAYTTAYADIITDTSDSYSGFDMQDLDVPFYQLTFQDNTLLTASGINTTVDYHQAFLKALETGCSLKYNLIYGDISELVGTDYNTMVSYSYSYWKDLAVEQYLDMQSAVGHLAGQKIVNHTYLTEDVTMTQYENATVIVNYGTEVFVYGDKQIPAQDYLVI